MKEKTISLIVTFFFIATVIAGSFSGCVTVPATCGNGTIDSGETCLNCPFDVGICNSKNITNSKGVSLAPVGSNIQIAIDTLGSSGGDVWLPEATLTTSQIMIKNNNIRIHGAGINRTVLILTSTPGLIASASTKWSNPYVFQWGLNNIQLDNVTFKGHSIWFTIRSGLVLSNIYGADITELSSAIRVTCPYGQDTNGDGKTDSAEAKSENIKIINCHVNRCGSYGFMLHVEGLAGCVFNNVLFSHCTVRKAGCYEFSSHGQWSVGFDLAEGYGIPDAVDVNGYMTVSNLVVDSCEAYDCWESGFHSESRPKKVNWQLINCISNNNGQKYIRTDATPGGSWYDGTALVTYGAGYLISYNSGFDSGLSYTNCKAYGNGVWGWRGSSSSYCPSFSDCSGDQYSSTSTAGNGRGSIPKLGTSYGGLYRGCNPIN